MGQTTGLHYEHRARIESGRDLILLMVCNDCGKSHICVQGSCERAINLPANMPLGLATLISRGAGCSFCSGTVNFHLHCANCGREIPPVSADTPTSIKTAALETCETCMKVTVHTAVAISTIKHGKRPPAGRIQWTPVKHGSKKNGDTS